MSVELNDENIGESAHNIHDKYYQPLVPTSYSNPLVKKNRYDPVSSSSKQALNNSSMLSKSLMREVGESAKNKECNNDSNNE